jgi:diketogulonate reductase-like aldo/keto reductase
MWDHIMSKRSAARFVFVQNRCIARFGWDEGVREVCLEEGIQYQGFSLVRANLADLDSPLLRGLMKKYKKSLPQLVFRFCQQMKFLCITGTTDAHHMRDDLKIYDFELTKSEMAQIKNLAAGS